MYRRIPAVHELLERPAVRQLLRCASREFLVAVIGETLEGLREEIRSGEMSEGELDRALELLDRQVEMRLRRRLAASLVRVINATGVVIFTNLGRAPVADFAIKEAYDAAVSYTNLEFDLEVGRRGHRDQHLEAILQRLLSCEAATVCNNAAAAVLLILNTLAEGKEVLISRGELIEIGGSFRIPAILEKSGARLREVGTTNKTRLNDYRSALSSDTGLILRVHPSNYRITGFTHSPTVEELVGLARESGVPLAYDLGSGCLFRTGFAFLDREPTVQDSIAAGVDIVCFSGDKLLGGPQAGLILGGGKWIDLIRRNPLMRTMRVDKIIYAVLASTLREYEKGVYQSTLPVWRMLTETYAGLEKRAAQISSALQDLDFQTEIFRGTSLPGGGSAPEEGIPSPLVRIRHSELSAAEIQEELRRAQTPVIGRIERDHFILDLRTVFPEQDIAVVGAFQTIAARPTRRNRLEK